MKDIQIGPADVKEKTTGQRTITSIIWLVSTARNIIVVVFCAVLGYMYKQNGNLPFQLSSNLTGISKFYRNYYILYTYNLMYIKLLIYVYFFKGNVESGLPDFKLPPFESLVGNETYNFVGMASKLGSGILVVPLLSILENISLAKFFGKFIF